MMNKLFVLFFIIGTHSISQVKAAEIPLESDLVICQDQAENFGNGKGDDQISSKCVTHFKTMAMKSSIVKESVPAKIKIYGYRNMIFLEKNVAGKIHEEIIAGSSTELDSIQALTIDDKNQEIAVLDEDGRISFFSSKITGNVAPFRIIKLKELEGANDLVVDSERELVIVNNNKTKKILFLSRLADIHGRKKNQSLDIKKSINTSTMDIEFLSLDFQKSELTGLDVARKTKTTIDLKKVLH